MGPHPSSNLQDEPATETLGVDGDGRGPRRPGPGSGRGPEGRRTLASRFREQPVLNSLLVLACIALIVIAYTAVGPSSSSSGQATRTSTAKYGVVQSTVSGSGNIQAASELDLGFETSGVITQIYVAQGQHVTEGQLLAELDPKSAEVTLEQAKANLQAAEAKLVEAQETDGETDSGAGSGSSGADAASTAKTAPTAAEPARSGTDSTAAQATISAALREANIASAKAAVRSDALAVQNDEKALANTKLLAPRTGTIVSLAGEVGETVSGGGTTKGSGSSGSGSGGSSSAGSGGASAASSLSAGSATGSGSSGSSSASSSFAVLSDLSSMQLVAPLSESEVGSVRGGQPATVTVEALEGTKLAAHVVRVATLPTSTSGVVSYDVTFQLDQLASGLKPGMSATAEVVVKQAEGVNVPTTAISADTVTVVRGGKQVRQRVVTGLAGDSSTIVLSGLKAGEEIVLPVARSSSSSLAGRLGSALGSRLGTGTLGGGAVGGLGGGFAGGGFAGGGFRGG
jgi:multidrug efflux pump subunit AcrA (membrane-fusion protein)